MQQSRWLNIALLNGNDLVKESINEASEKVNIAAASSLSNMTESF